MYFCMCLCVFVGLYESLLYHAVRSDNRHNFSAYFYALYLRHGSSSLRLMAFLPQLLLPIGTSVSQSLRLAVACCQRLAWCCL